MRPTALLALALAATGFLASPGSGRAQDNYTFSVSLLGGVGGGVDENSAGMGNQTLEVGFSLLREDQVQVGLRLGEVDFDQGDSLAGLTNPTLAYVLAGGEYRFVESFYVSGLFGGVGFYELEGLDSSGTGRSDSGIGLALGVSGEFEISRRLGILVELTGHVADLEGAQVFATGLVGLSAHF